MNTRTFDSLHLLRVLAALPMLLSAFTLLGADNQDIRAAASATLPFKVEVVEVANSIMPAVHSYSSGMADGKWLILNGRVAGLHGLGPGKDNFPRATANTMAYVIDPGGNKVLGSVDLVKHLPAQLAGPMTATNAEFAQVDGDLFIIGGYGQDLVNSGMTTFGTVTKVDVGGLIKAIIGGETNIAKYFTQNPSSDNRLKVTGGGLKVSHNNFFLVFGQDFSGFYSIENGDYNRAGGQFQKYTEKVRVFTLNADLSIKDFKQIDGGFDQNLPYHRRDLNVVDIIQPDSTTPAATIYGGVFRAGQVAGHTIPIDISFSTAPDAVTVRSGFKQGLNHYDCANVTVYDQASSSSFTTLFGGISQFHYDSTTNTLVQDQIDLGRGVDGLPFINSISTIQRKPTAGAFAQFIQPTALPGLVGTDAQFLFSPQIQTAGQLLPNGVINLSRLNGRSLVGHLVGGIESFGPYSLLVKAKPSTVSTKRLFEIWITPGATPVIPMPALPTATTPVPSAK